MMRLISCLITVALAGGVGATAIAQDATEWAARAEEQYTSGQFAESADSYGRAMEAGATNPVIYFNAACSAALAGRIDAAFAHLDGALERGWKDADSLLGDKDFANLHGDPRWQAVLDRCRKAEASFIASLGQPGLRAELLEMRRIDQAMRQGEALPELEGKSWHDIDGVNTARMKEIVAEHGWPTGRLVGEDGARSAWLLVQHADADPGFQRRCLELMKAAPEGEVSAVDVAYLTDRVRVNEGKKQLYGTQFRAVDGQMVPRPIEDEEGLEARRAELGMISMKEYTARITGRN